MTITIYSILNSIIWSSVLAVPLFCFSRSSKVIRKFGVVPSFIVSIGCLIRCVFVVEIGSAKEIGVPFVLNHVNDLMVRAANGGPLERWFIAIWILGSLLAGCFWLSAYIVQFWTLRLLRADKAESGEFLCEKRNRSLRIVFTSRVEIPCVVGIRHGVILLPPQHYDAQSMKAILLHESAHIEHHDSLIDLSTRLLCIVYWWNPAIYICRNYISNLCDFRCDLKATENSNAAWKRLYCQTMLDFATKKHSIGQSFATANLKARFNLILRERTGISVSSLLILIPLLMLFVLQTYMIVVQPAYQPENIEYIDYAMTPENSFIEQVDSESYRIVAGGESFLISKSEMDLMLQESFGQNNKKQE